jgi:transposase InsO family protein
MPWQERSSMSLREEFVTLASQEGANVRALCRRFAISAKTGYKWLARYRQEGPAGLQDRSRRPHHAPGRTAPEVEAQILALRSAHPAWGGRKLRARLRGPDQQPAPSASTITAILHRHHQIDPLAAPHHRPYQRFERARPNELWQMDFKGHFALAPGGRCHPLSVLDDHSRFNVGLVACADEQEATVQAHLTALFRRYGLPEALLADNGPPWGTAGAGVEYTALTVWLLRLGIRVLHGRPHHPQTQGKAERFHRTLTVEALRDGPLADLAACQQAFDRFRQVYNTERPHEALGDATPASRYQASPRPFPAALPPIEYAPAELVRRVQQKGEISLRNQSYLVGKAFRGYPVALRPTPQDHLLEVYFCTQKVAQIDLTQPKGAS